MSDGVFNRSGPRDDECKQTRGHYTEGSASELLPVFKEIVCFLKGPALVNRKESGIAVMHTGEPTVVRHEPALGVLRSGVKPAPSGPWFLQVHMEVA